MNRSQLLDWAGSCSTTETEALYAAKMTGMVSPAYRGCGRRIMGGWQFGSVQVVKIGRSVNVRVKNVLGGGKWAMHKIESLTIS